MQDINFPLAFVLNQTQQKKTTEKSIHPYKLIKKWSPTKRTPVHIIVLLLLLFLILSFGYFRKQMCPH